MRVQLTLLNGEKIDVHVPRETITIGRSNKCDLVIPQESISRQHCKVEIKGGEFFITDLGSINGVYIEGNKILPNEATPFQTYLNISFGCVTNSQFTADETRVGIQLQSSFGKTNAGQSGNTATIATSKQVSKLANKQQGSSNTPQSKIEAKKTAKNSNTLALNFIIFFGIMAALYYYLYADKEAQSTILNSPSATQAAPKNIESNDHF